MAFSSHLLGLLALDLLSHKLVAGHPYSNRTPIRSFLRQTTIASRRVLACTSTSTNLSGMTTVSGTCRRAPVGEEIPDCAVNAERATPKDDLAALEDSLA